ncbi:hypothetical protein CL684_02940 [Candidatus Campbellbacteria bacterium]|nr:hypothetical protein [Candidatus Campbellbacteria bacterium]|tara:strand:- start:576 stop:764 length:189 start_codon:yes stop_codon:yes gene_type:complete
MIKVLRSIGNLNLTKKFFSKKNSLQVVHRGGRDIPGVYTSSEDGLAQSLVEGEQHTAGGIQK